MQVRIIFTKNKIIRSRSMITQHRMIGSDIIEWFFIFSYTFISIIIIIAIIELTLSIYFDIHWKKHKSNSKPYIFLQSFYECLVILLIYFVVFLAFFLHNVALNSFWARINGKYTLIIVGQLLHTFTLTTIEFKNETKIDLNRQHMLT